MKKDELSYTEKAVLHLHSIRGQWLEGFKLAKANLSTGWCGPSTERRMRDVSNIGYHTIKGIKYFVEQKMESGYVWYRVTGGEKTETVPVFKEVEGRIVVEIKQEKLLV